MDSSPIYDVIVIGVGAMGSSALYHLSKTPNLSILGIDQYSPPHDQGSSHGETRLTRLIYWQHASYVPLIKRSHFLWRQLETETNKQLFVPTGGIYIGYPDTTLLKKLMDTSKKEGFDIELFSAEEIMKRFPAFKLPEGMIGVYDYSTGVLFPERCVEAFIDEAKKRGAQMKFGEKVLEIQKEDKNVQTILTDKGKYRAKKIIVSAGAYVVGLLKDLNLPWKADLKAVCWIEPEKGFESDFKPDKLPVFRLVDKKTGIKLAGFPDMLGTGVKTPIKINKSKGQNVYEMERKIDENGEKILKEKITNYMPKIFGKVKKTTTCLVTKFPDKNFLIDFLPSNNNIILASPCSAHGFKFAAVIGEALKDLALFGKSEFDLEIFSFKNKFIKNSKI